MKVRKAGRSVAYLFEVGWGCIAVISGWTRLAGSNVVHHFSRVVVAGTVAIAAGAIRSMLVNTVVYFPYFWWRSK
jgi:ZIP family zinc transporter